MKTWKKWMLCAVSAFSVLSCVSAPASAATVTPSKVPTVVAFGDSITASGAWFAKAEKQFGFQVKNKAVGGWTSSDGKAAVYNALSLKPDLLLLSFGMNDSSLDMQRYVPLETYCENMRFMIGQAKKQGAKILIVIENPIGAEQYYTRHDKTVFEPYGGICAFYTQYVEAIRGIAAEYGIPTADLFAVFSAQEDYNRFLADGVHPNAAGYALYADAFCDALADMWRGDIDGNGTVNARDYMLLKRVAWGLDDLGSRTVLADLDGNGKINGRDCMMLKYRLLGMGG